MDLIKELGELAFAARLKRLSERLMKDGSRIYQELEVDFEARWFTVLHALSKRSPMSVTALAQALGLTHTAVNFIAGEMAKKKLLLSIKDRKDERRRLLRLSKHGEAVAATLGPVWEQIRLETKALIESSQHDVLAAIGRIEEQLDEKDMFERVCAAMNIEPRDDVEIVDYRPAYKKHFKSLNYEWLQQHFVVEDADEALLADPNGRIIRKGGAILFARAGDDIVGTCALLRHSPDVAELTKMAVTARYRGRKIGLRLAEATIDRARGWGVRELFLQTSPRLVAAVQLYKKLGFQQTVDYPYCGDPYDRCSINMKLDL